MESLEAIGAAVRARFGAEFGAGGERLFQAPGRVNLLGGHIDYHGGPVLPAAVDARLVVALRARGDRRVLLRSREFDDGFDLELPGAAAPFGVESVTGWAVYPVAAASALLEAGYRISGFELVVGASLPPGGGLSSSAALLVATISGLAAVSEILLEPVEIARLAHRAETRFVGVQCGIMDQYTVALAREDTVLYLDCADQSYRHLPLAHADAAVLVFDSMRRHELAVGDYNTRVAESGSALKALRARLPQLGRLAQLGEADLQQCRDLLDDLQYRRARHVASEVRRVVQGCADLERGDYAAFGQAMNESYRSLRDDYETVSDRVAFLQEAASSQAGVFGARVTGAGFGGCLVALARPDAAAAAMGEVAKRFQERYAEAPDCQRLEIAGGAGEIHP